MKTFRLVDPVFKTEPVFILGCTAEDARAFLLRRYRARVTSLNSGPVGTMIARDRFPYRIVWCRNKPETPATIGELLHEIFHLVTRICSDKGVPIRAHIDNGECGDEAAAYLFEFFAAEALRRCRPHRKAGKK